MNTSKKKWFRLLIAGTGMIMISIILSGGLLHTIIESPESWLYIIGLSCAAGSSLVTGLLMLFDAAKYRLNSEFRKLINSSGPKTKGRKKKEETSTNIERRMESLVKDCERLRPESMKTADHE